MQVKSLVLSAAVAFQASTAVAEVQRPRIYFPRHVKRQFTNTTTTSPDVFPPPENTPSDSQSESRNFITSFRNTVSDLVSTNSESSAPTTSDDLSTGDESTTIIISTTERAAAPEPTSPVTTSFFFPPVRSSTTDAEPVDETTQQSTRQETTADETTIPQRDASTGGLPSTILQPTEAEDDPTTTTSTRASTSAAVPTTTEEATQPEETTTSSSPAIVIGPTGVVSSSTPATTPTTRTSSSTPELEASTAESANTTIVADLPETTTSTRVPTTLEPATTLDAATTTPTEPSTSSVAATTSDVPATTSTEAATTEAATTTSRLLDPIVSIVSDILPTVPANITETSSTTIDLVDPTTTLIEVTTTDASGATSVISDITPVPTIVEPTITPNSTDSELPGETSTPPVDTSVATSLPPIVTSISSLPPVESPVPVNTTTDLLPPSVTETSLPTVLPSESGGSIGNETSLVPEPTVSPTDLPVSSGLPSSAIDVPEPASSTAVPAASTGATDVSTASTAEDTGTATPTATSAPPPPDTWMPTTIVAEQSTPTLGLTVPGASFTTDVAMPSDLPQVISPDTQDVTQPEGTRLLQVGFLYAENYQFVTEEPMAAAQIFTYLPVALAHGAQIDQSKVKVVRLVPFDTRASLGYITTLARFYYPESMVDKLRMDIKYPNSLLYNHEEELVYNLTSNINPAIDIIPGSEVETNVPGNSGTSPEAPNGNTNILGNSENESTPIQKGTAAAIGIGAVSVAAAYGAAMFLVARRYKQRKQAHRRSSSIANSSEMRYAGNGSPAMMGGALLSRDFTGYGYGGMAGGRNSHGSGRSGAGNSVRTAQISAPVAAENSLGWN